MLPWLPIGGLKWKQIQMVIKTNQIIGEMIGYSLSVCKASKLIEPTMCNFW